MKTVLFVPGFQETMATRDYASAISAIKQKGYAVEFVPINWARTTIDQWLEELDAAYQKHDPTQTILAGFSYGAMIAFVTASKRVPSELWLFSLSPYFAEDLESKHMKPAWLKSIGHRRVSAFSLLNFGQLSKSITCRTLLFVGQLEINKWPVLNERVTDAHARLQNNKLIVVNSVGHDVASANYIRAISKTI